MRVALDVAPLMNPLTGVGQYTLHLLRHLIQRGDHLDFQLFALTWNTDRRNFPAGQGLPFKHIKIPARIAVTVWEILGYPPVQRWVGDVDVVHGPNFLVPPLRDGRGVITIHDMTFMLYPQMCTPQVRRYRWIVPRVLQRCRLVITPSETVRKQVAELLHFPQDRIVVTPEGVSGVFVGASSDPGLLESLGIDEPYVLFAGTSEPRKNLSRLIRAFTAAETQGLKLVVAGPQGWGEDPAALASLLGLENRVIFTGYVEDRDLASLVASARAFAYPSIYEGFGLSPLEAMSAGVPVIAGRAGSLPEVLDDAPFWCDPLDVDSITEAVIAATADGPARDVATKRGREVAGLYSWDETARLTLEAYRRVASGDS